MYAVGGGAMRIMQVYYILYKVTVNPNRLVYIYSVVVVGNAFLGQSVRLAAVNMQAKPLGTSLLNNT